ncbi:hypothetical protein ACYJ1Y_07030 [Natrialbaceae archaeon A-gly3]
MASRDHTPDRKAVFDRDEGTCQLCRTGVGPDEARTYPIGPDAEDLAAHPSQVVTVCTDCLGRLRGETGTPESPVDVFRSVRTITETQSETVAEAADFASQATSFPDVLSAGEVPPYATDRRRLALSVRAVEADLETLTAGERSELEAAAQVSLEDFLRVSRDLQESLEELLGLVEAVAIAFGRCHVCFEPLEDRRADCPACGTARRSIGRWRGEDGAVEFDRLFGELSESLIDASETTEEVARRTTVVAETLAE